MPIDRSAPIWLTWRSEKKGEEWTKVPYQTNGRHASSTNPSTWDTYANVQNVTPKDGIGIVFESTQKIFGIDLDKILPIPTHPLPFNLNTFLQDANTYIEYSPSKTGLHLLFQLDPSSPPINIPHHKIYLTPQGLPKLKTDPHFEGYSTGRYFTYTGDKHQLSRPIRTLHASDFDLLLQSIGYPWASTSLSDEQVLHLLLQDPKRSALYNGDISLYNSDDSSADAALASHLAYWTGKNPDQMRRLWLASPLGRRQKTQSRPDYQDRTIQNAINFTQNTYTTSTTSTQNDDPYSFHLNPKTQTPELIWPNINRVLCNDLYFKNHFRLNEFSHLTESKLLSPSTSTWIPLNDHIISLAREYICEHFPDFRRLSSQMTAEAILRAAAQNPVNPPRDYLTSLTWDKTPRLDVWLHHTFGTPDDDLHQAIGANWLKGLTRRVMHPGCQFDEVLALESPQGWRKSTALRVLGSPWHVETTHSIDSKDFYLLIAQNVIVEFSEGEIFDRASVNRLKAEITKLEDQVRPPYERGVVRFPRSCVFAVSTNSLELKDDTGNRRWLPVTLTRPADIEWLTQHKDQLLAEAYHRAITLQEPSHIYPPSLRDLQQNKGEYSDYDEKAHTWYQTLSCAYRQEEGLSLHHAIENVLKVTEIQKIHEIRMASILRRSLHLENKNKRVDGAVLKRWFPTPQTPTYASDNEIPFL